MPSTAAPARPQRRRREPCRADRAARLPPIASNSSMKPIAPPSLQRDLAQRAEVRADLARGGALEAGVERRARTRTGTARRPRPPAPSPCTSCRCRARPRTARRGAARAAQVLGEVSVGQEQVERVHDLVADGVDARRRRTAGRRSARAGRARAASASPMVSGIRAAAMISDQEEQTSARISGSMLGSWKRSTGLPVRIRRQSRNAGDAEDDRQRRQPPAAQDLTVRCRRRRSGRRARSPVTTRVSDHPCRSLSCRHRTSTVKLLALGRRAVVAARAPDPTACARPRPRATPGVHSDGRTSLDERPQSTPSNRSVSQPVARPGADPGCP